MESGEQRTIMLILVIVWMAIIWFASDCDSQVTNAGLTQEKTELRESRGVKRFFKEVL